MGDLNVAVIGCGGMGGAHIARWSEISGANLVAVCDIDAACAMRAATEFGSEAHTDWRGALAVEGVNVVDICTPTADHLAIAKRAFERGIAVLCETPLARTADECAQMVELAQRTDTVLMPAMAHRFHPLAVFAKELIENDDLGRIAMFRMRLSDQLPSIVNRWVADASIAGPGVLTDVTIHAADVFRWLVGEIVDVSGYTTTLNPLLNVPDSAVLTVQAPSGALGVIETSWSTPGGLNVLELYGTAGACIIDYDAGVARYRTADMVVWGTKEVNGPDRFLRMIGHFSDVIRGVQTPVVSATDGLRALQIISAIV